MKLTPLMREFLHKTLDTMLDEGVWPFETHAFELEVKHQQSNDHSDGFREYYVKAEIYGDCKGQLFVEEIRSDTRQVGE